LKESNLY